MVGEFLDRYIIFVFDRSYERIINFKMRVEMLGKYVWMNVWL